MSPNIESFYHKPTFTWCHIVYCRTKKQAVIIDPVLDYDSAKAEITDSFANNIINFIEAYQLEPVYVLETHAHADHITAASLLKRKYPEVKIGIGEGICNVQSFFNERFNMKTGIKILGTDFDLLLKEGQVLVLGDQRIRVINTPGHTEESVSYVIENYVFIGDTLFSPDYGTARCDFPGGDSAQLYESIQKIFSLGIDKRLYLCHDYPKSNRAPKPFFTSLQQQQENIHINRTVTKEQFVIIRDQRDLTLNQPELLIPSIQLNINAGEFPREESNGVSYLKIPLTINVQ